MDASDYQRHWQELFREKNALVNERTNLETALNEVKVRIAHLEEVLTHLAHLSGVSFADDVSKLGITDAIRLSLKSSPERMSAAEVRRSLVDSGFDMSGQTAPMASIYKVLSRLAADGGDVEREKEDDGSVFFKWKRDEITDDDIPF